MTRVLPCGSWPSPLTPEAVAASSVGLGQLGADGEDVLWAESRPAEGGRTVVVRWRPGGAPEDLTPPPWNVRSRVHEYGGGAFAVAGGLVCFSHDADQRVYRLDGGAPRPLTPPGAARYADGAVDRRRGLLFAVREDHGAGGAEPENALVRIPLDGGGAPAPVVRGRDFVAAPRLAPDGGRLAWLAWDHPNMPWDGTELWLAELDGAGGLRDARRVAGGPAESVLQPLWSPDGRLHFVSDASGWWNLWRLGDAGPEPCCPLEAEFAVPPWALGTATYGFAADGAVVAAWCAAGRWRLGRVDPASRRLHEIPLPCTDIGAVVVAGARVALRAAGPASPAAVLVLEDGQPRTLRASAASLLGPADVALAEPLELPGRGGRGVHALLYRPAHAAVRAPAGERPPLVVRAHGGPTGAAGTGFDPLVQLFTSRGFAFLDVDYAGSTGHGRAYRLQLEGAWGVADVEDVVDAARAVAARGLADGARLVARGSSAGGFTALCAMAFHDVFRAASSWYGIADLEALARQTHKFEAHAEERLVGPHPEAAAIYRARSPLHHAAGIRRPVLLLQGLDDRVVPPAQSAALAAVLRGQGVPVVHVEFPGESHGFRRAETIRRALAAELAFFAAVLGIALADPPEPLPGWPAGSPAGKRSR